MSRPVEDAVGPDGSPVEVYLRLPPGDAPEIVHGAVPDGAQILELGCGTGRVTHALLALGHPVVAVDNSAEMLRHVQGAETVLADIETLELGRRFPVVLLGSHLVNADDASRPRLLGACRRHVSSDGRVLIERLEPDFDWLANQDVLSQRGGVIITLRNVQLVGDRVSAVAEYRIGEHVWRQPFASLLLDDEALEDELAAAGLRLTRILDERRTWIEAAPE